MGVLLQGAGDGLNQTFGRAKVQPDFWPFFRPKQGGGDGLNRTFGQPKVRRADRSAESQVRSNPVSFFKLYVPVFGNQ